MKTKIYIFASDIQVVEAMVVLVSVPQHHAKPMQEGSLMEPMSLVMHPRSQVLDP